MADVTERLSAALADRYAIERELGSGGMATVYLAEDLKHHRKVAVKVLRPELAALLGPERFLREIEIAAQLQHPHILPLHDSGEADRFVYYVMPYVEGESLRDRLGREGELPIADVVRILRDVADALTEAHARGLVHCDIKPDNVLLRGRHAVVADFGVAKAVSEATAREQLTTAGVALGTPAYMAPEQAAADPHIDHRADIYALGILGYELLAGHPPFRGKTKQMVLSAQVTEAPEPVTRHRTSVPPALARLVMRCLEKRPADRWQSAEQLLEQLEALATPSGGMAPAQPVPPTSEVPEASPVKAKGLAAAAISIARGVRGTLAGRIPKRVVVAPFDNQTGDPALDPLGMMAADWLTQALTETGFLEVVDAQTVRAAAGSLPGAALREQASWWRAFAAETRAGTIISGTYYRQGDLLEFRTRITDARRGTVLSGVAPARGPCESAHQALEALRERVAAALAEEFDTRLGTWQSGASRAPLYSAYLSYLGGLEAYLEWDMAAASSHFERALSLDPAYTRALLMAGQAHHLAGEQLRSAPHLERAFAIAEKLVESRDRLHRYDRAHVDFFVALTRHDWVAAYRAARDMMEAAPGSDDARREAAISALRVRRPREALALLAQLESERGLLRRWRNEYWALVTGAHHHIGDYRKEVALARRARRRHPDNVMLMANEARALAALHRVDEVFELLDGILDRALTAPDVAGVYVQDVVLVFVVPDVPVTQAAFRLAGTELRAHGHPEAASATFEKAIACLESRWENEPAGPGRGVVLGDLLYLAEQWDRATDEFQRLHEEDPTDVAPLGYLGVLAARRGDSERAAEIVTALGRREVDPLFRRIPLQQRCWRARIAAVLGRREEAVAMLRPIYERGAPSGLSLYAHTEMDFESLRGYPPFDGLTRPEG